MTPVAAAQVRNSSDAAGKRMNIQLDLPFFKKNKAEIQKYLLTLEKDSVILSQI